MTGPTYQRRDPQPINQGWEVAVAVIGGAVLLVALAALGGLGVASALWGSGWVWPHGTDTITRVLRGLSQGHPGRGLPTEQQTLVAPAMYVYLCVGLLEVAMIVAAIAAGVAVARYRRPGDARGGMATRGEAEQVLGVSRLRAAHQLIRPDLHPSRTGTGMSRRR